MRTLTSGSIVFRLWLALSMLAMLFTTWALGTYVYLSVRDSVNAAHDETMAKSRVVMVAAQRLSQEVQTPNTVDVQVAQELGVQSLRFFDPTGASMGNSMFGSLVTEPDVQKRMVADALAGKGSHRRVRLKDAAYASSSISPLDVLRGGNYGEEYVLPEAPAAQSASGRGAVQFVIQYPEVTSEARTQLYRSLWVGLVIISATVIGMWLFLRLFVTRPLRRYGQLALRIARGEDTVRMPAEGSDELAELGRALNGMADALEHQATVDSLTGLFNLRHLSSNLEALINDAKSQRRPLSLIVGDLDNLKPVNDTYGHLTGDRLLQSVSDTLRSWAGPRFTCWRLGGDEFVVALPRTNEEEGLSLANEVRGRIAALQIPTGSAPIRTSISVGVATFPKDGSSAGDLLAAADRRMYALKTLRAEERRLALQHPDRLRAA